MAVIGIDAHKRTQTMVAVDEVGRKLGTKTVEATTAGHFSALRWAADKFGPEVLWGVADTRAMTARLEADLMGAGQQVVRVPTQLMARTRRLARERGKSDPIDALAVARAVLAHPDLPVARHSPWSRDIKLLADRRESLLKHRTAMTNRLLWRVHELDPTHLIAPRSLVWRKNQAALAEWLQTQPGVLAEVARAELGDVSAVTVEINALERRLAPMVRAVAPALLDLHGCGTNTAARIVGETAEVSRFKSEAAFASYAGVTPVPHWSGSSRRRLRSHKGGNRALNAALHQITLVRIMAGGPAAAEYRHRTEAKAEPHASAMRRLKRRLARTVYRRLRADQRGMALRGALADLERRAESWSAGLGTLPPVARTAKVRRRIRSAPPLIAEEAVVAVLAALNDEWAQALTGEVIGGAHRHHEGAGLGAPTRIG